MDEELNIDESFNLSDRVLNYQITADEVDGILNRMLDETNSDADTERIIEYIVQLFYRSGIRETSLRAVHEKMLKMIEEKIMTRMQQLGLVEITIDDQGAVVPISINKGK